MEPYFIYKDEIAAFIGRMYTLNCTLVMGRRIQELHLLAIFYTPLDPKHTLSRWLCKGSRIEQTTSW